MLCNSDGSAMAQQKILGVLLFQLSSLTQATVDIDGWRVTANRHQITNAFQKESSPEMRTRVHPTW